VTALSPNLHLSAAESTKLYPEMSTAVPPEVEPEAGSIEMREGSRRKEKREASDV
jgi:hypothetical protein